MKKVVQFFGIVAIALAFLLPGCISQKVVEETKEPVAEEPVVHELVNIGDEIYSGIVFFVDRSGRHGLICGAKDLGQFYWDAAEKACNDLKGGWRLPTRDELRMMYTNLQKNELGGFAKIEYWSSSEYDGDSNFAWYQNFSDGSEKFLFKGNDVKDGFYNVRAVRAF